MGQKGSGSTTVQQQPPQIIPEGKPGYLAANQFYMNNLESPPIYGGPRVAPQTAGQTGYIDQTYSSFGSRNPMQQAAEQETTKTATGSYLPGDPKGSATLNPLTQGNYQVANPTAMYSDRLAAGSSDIIGGPSSGGTVRNVSAPKAAYSNTPWNKPGEQQIRTMTESAMQPYVRTLQQDVLPQINSDFGINVGGINNTREFLTEFNALQRTNTQIGQEVLAPMMMEMERLDEHFKNAESDRRAAIATGDADRATRASQTMADVQGRMDMVGAEFENQRAIAAAGLKNQRDIAAAELGGQGALAAMGAGEARRQSAAQLGTGMYEGERNRMVQTPGMVGQNQQNEAMRLAMNRAAGDYEQAFNQKLIDEERAIFEEPLYRQSQAANALAQMAGMGPGGSTVSQSQSSEDPMGDIMGVISTGAMVASMVMKSSKTLKTDIRPVDNVSEIVEGVLNTDVKRWRYITDPSYKERIGGLLEEMPRFMHNDGMTLDVVSVIGGLMLTIQNMDKRIKELEGASQTSVA